MRRRLLIRVAVAAAVLVPVALAAAVVWTQIGPAPTPDARATAAAATTAADGWFAFAPDTPRTAPTTGVVIYPGARIDAEAYAPVARDLARRTGALVAVVRVPLGMALLDTDAAGAVMAANPRIAHWVVAGHSLGGVAAARFATDRDDVGGLLLWASYPDGGTTVPDAVAVTVVTGTRDRVLDRAALRDARARLPDGTREVALDGVTHAQFGDYGTQAGDGTPTVSAAAARRMIVNASRAVVTDVAGRR